MNITLRDDQSEWLQRFRAKHGRPLAVLHIGNVANNGYMNAKFLNAAGFDNDVICYDYYHIMSCPEWEDGDFEGDILDQAYPAWENVRVRNFERPAWFAQGLQSSCLQYLLARRTRSPEEKPLWAKLESERVAICASLRGALSAPKPNPLVQAFRIGLRKAKRLRRLIETRLRWSADSADFAARRDSLIAEFGSTFPERTDRLVGRDFRNYYLDHRHWRALLPHYDAVIGYATDGVFPLLCGFRPYFAFEHGTIRNIPFEANMQGRLCALTYRKADGVFITNCDNLKAAQKLGLQNFRFVPHPMPTAGPPIDPKSIREELKRQHGCEFIVFHPSRQHWSAGRHSDWEKGNDILIRGFARFVKEIEPKAHAVFVKWGQTIRESRELIDELGISHAVSWVDPMPNPRLLAYIEASDATADQFYLGAFGSIMPKALMLGRPCLIKFDPDMHRWCFDEMPPVANCGTPEETFEALLRMRRDPPALQAMQEGSRRWFQQHHSNDRVAQTLLDGIAQAVERGAQGA